MDCGGCVGECPHDAIDLDFGKITFLPNCVECNLCVEVCPVDAIEPRTGTPGNPRKLPRTARWFGLREAEEGAG